MEPPGDNKPTPARWTLNVLRLIWTLAAASAVVGAMVAGYALHWRVFDAHLATVGVYGIVVLAITLLQFVFSTVNNRWLIPRKRKLAKETNFLPTVGLQVVGYREDPVLFAACLRSLAACEYSNLKGVVVCLDGNESDADMAMARVFEEVFPAGRVIKTDKLGSVMTPGELAALLSQVSASSGPVCIAQPHGGKREAMWTSFNVLLHWDCEWSFTTDSDTVVMPDAVTEMVAAAVDPCTGAVCGEVLIFNVLNWVSFLSALRYWYAFCVERASQSLWGSVTCVSGPIGLYRSSALRQILNRWVRQRFLGSKATFGDDRHLTNLVISLGQKVYFTQHAKCWTDTPVPLVRFLAQQLRWSKSFFREICFNFMWLHKGSVWLGVELAVQTAYPFFICTTMIYVLAIKDLDVIVLVPIIAFIMSGLRAVWAIFNTGRLEFVYYVFYSAIYMLFLVPTKLFAILTLWSTGWGTSVRSAVVNRWSQAIHAIIWAVGIVCTYVAIIIWLAVAKGESLSWIVAGTGIGEAAVLALLVLLWATAGQCWYLPKMKRQMDTLLSAKVATVV
jgi:hyaluronan synthase